MKTTTLALIVFLTGLDLWAQMPPPHMPLMRRFGTNAPSGVPSLPNISNSAMPSGTTPFPTPALPTRSAEPSVLPNNSQSQKEIPGYTFNYEGVDVNQVLDVYANLVGRTLIRGSVPAASIILKTQSPLTKTEAIEALQAVLAVNNIAVIPIGDKFAKVVPTDQAGGAGGELNYMEANNLPDMGSYVTHIVQLKYIKPSAMVPFISPLAKINSIIPIDDNGILIIRDYAENIKRMLEMINQIDVNTPLEYTNEVIPIKYALATDIADALNSLGGQGSATVTFGSSGSPSAISGVANSRTGINGATSSFGGTSGSTGNQTYNNQSRSTYGAQGTSTPNGTPTAGTTFQDRLRMALQNAAKPTGTPGEEQPIQVFGEAKIIADERANSLLVFATRADMERIKAVVSKLDVLLSQVLIEAVIIDYSLGPNTLNFGVSAAQNPSTYASNPQIVGAGGFNNGQTLLGLLNGVTGLATNESSVFGDNLPGGLSYFGDIGPKWDVALQAAASDSHASVIQRPRIQTSQAKPAQFFVGETVPYVTGTSYGTGYNGANSSSYSQLSVGVELDVTPFINPDGLVVMDINQEIDDLDGTTEIDGVGAVPNTDKRTLSSEIAVKDKDTVMLGGFIKNQKSTAKAGIPILMDIPILGNLFSSRSDSKQREELIVMMRPTVLKTPEIAAANTVQEEQRLPGVSEAEEENDAEEAQRVAAERKEERRREHIREENNGNFTAVPVPPPATLDTNLAVPLP